MKKIFLLLGGCIIGLLLCEVFVRMFHLYPETFNLVGCFRFVDNPLIVYELIPGADSGCGYINKQGFRRNGEFQRLKPAGVVRIAMLGDSITQGLYARQGETFSDQLERLLNEKVKATGGPVRYEVMNCGASAYNLGAEVETLRTKVLQYHPDIVVLNMFHTDNEPVPGLRWLIINNNDLKEQLVAIRKYYDEAPLFHMSMRKILQYSKLWLFFKERMWNIKKGMSSLNSIKKHYADDDWGMNRIYDGFSEIKRLSNQFGFKVMVCIHSHLLFGEHPNNQQFEEIAKEYGFPCFHMIEYYRKVGVSPDSINIKDIPSDRCHPNELGHKIIAEAMFSELKRNGFIDLQ